MITFICCSIKPTMADVLRQNIEMTLGDMPFELIAFDNRETKYGICKVYNLCAERAKYDYLCFLHEDVQFNTTDWGRFIINKLSDKGCGLIGFAGSQYKYSLLISPGWGAWTDISSLLRDNLIQHFKAGRNDNTVHAYRNPDKVDFAQVVTLDGLCIFVRKNVWEECKFDEVTFPGFHYYDVDFSIATAINYTNYVCNIIEIEHFSEGSPSKEWEDAAVVGQKKWESKFPLMTADFRAKKYGDKEFMADIEYKTLINAMDRNYYFFDADRELSSLARRYAGTKIGRKVWRHQLLYKESIKHKRIYLLHIIPILTIVYYADRKWYRLFEVLPIWRSRRSQK
ncbi:MAG: glycosyltransferase [Rikenellaceae bacterium]